MTFEPTGHRGAFEEFSVHCAIVVLMIDGQRAIIAVPAQLARWWIATVVDKGSIAHPLKFRSSERRAPNLDVGLRCVSLGFTFLTRNAPMSMAIKVPGAAVESSERERHLAVCADSLQHRALYHAGMIMDGTLQQVARGLD